jgi:hypothetical protein
VRNQVLLNTWTKPHNTGTVEDARRVMANMLDKWDSKQMRHMSIRSRESDRPTFADRGSSSRASTGRSAYPEGARKRQKRK